ncbi:ABC transporter substrate-binding protein [Virgibacillus halophilus]|uniref:ABC transporter substrate-binding protein n=2 Tax=Tigheibacillus halophilus TaxID=361280 RepID=A0ABU5C7R8_9BACI|nr:ABC transporter substrate-binding protein [Virgibacillus halophilus]
MEYVTELRLQEAKRLMNQGNLKIKEIAHEIGYKDEFYFSRKFRKETGMTPTNYMKNVKQKVVAYTSNIIGHLIPLQVIPYAAPMHPKWTSYYYHHYRREIPLPLSAYRINEEWETNMMRVMQESVDIIITSAAIQPKEQTLLEKTASVIYVPQQINSWRNQFLYIANKLDKNELAHKWLQTYEQKAASINAALCKQFMNKTTAVLRMVNDSLYIETGNQLFSFLFEDLHSFVPHSLSLEKLHQPITIDSLSQLQIDCIFMLVRQDDETRKNWDMLQRTEQWQQLPAVRTGNVMLVSSDPWLENSAHAYLRKLDSVAKLFSNTSSQFRSMLHVFDGGFSVH